MDLRAERLRPGGRLVNWLFVLALSGSIHLGAAEFKQVIDGVGYVRVGASENNVYVVGSISNALIIDAHYDSSAQETITALEGAGIKPGHVRAVAITHAHDDHFGGAGAIAKWSRAPIWAHLATAAEMEDPWSGFARPGALFPNTAMPDWTNYQSKAGVPSRVDRVLREGDVIDHGGFTLEVLHIPGHDRSAIALFERTRSWVFSGDLAQRGGPGWFGLFTDVASQRKSLIRIRDLKPEWYFGGHGTPIFGPAKIETELNSALDWLDTVEKFLLDTLREKSPLRTIDITRAAWRKIFEKAGRDPAHAQEVSDPREYSIVSVNAVLLDLSRRGLVKRNRDLDWELATSTTPVERQK